MPQLNLTADQVAGASFLARSKIAMLADVPGLGKTAQAVRACDVLGVRSATVLVPNQTLAVNFAAEFGKWSLYGHDTHILRRGTDEIPPRGVLFTTYALASRPEVARRLVKRRVDALICDEAHALKERGSQRTKLALRKTGLLGSTARAWLLTGTPAPNHAGELYVFAKVTGAWPGSYGQFVERFCICNENAFGIQIVGSKNHEELKALLAPYYIRRTKVEGRPPLTVDTRFVSASSSIDPYEKLAPADLESVKLAIETGNWSLADIPAVATVRRAVGLAKADGVAELVNAERDGGFKKILVFAWHSDVIDRLHGLIPDSAVFDGRTSQACKEEIDRAIRGGSGPGVVIAQLAAAGVGYTWLDYHRCIIAEPAWTPDVNDQAIARAWRKGQASPVLASFVALKGSLDQRITAALHRKSEDVARFI
jgi:SWI/SNF-related matrix-associated actin-dependent regulator 1 of chromatin subfamily A